MAALRVDFADVQLSKPAAEFFQDEKGLGHCGIHLVCVPDVKAKRRARKPAEDVTEFSCSPSPGLALVHVFNTEDVTEDFPCTEVSDGVRVNNEGPLPKSDPL